MPELEKLVVPSLALPKLAPDLTSLHNETAIVPVRIDSLSRRERRILDFVSRGDNNLQIGELAGLSKRAVSKERMAILDKTEARNMPHAVYGACVARALFDSRAARRIPQGELTDLLVQELALIAQGHSPQESEDILGGTANSRRFNLRKALGAITNEHAVRIAHEEGILPI